MEHYVIQFQASVYSVHTLEAKVETEEDAPNPVEDFTTIKIIEVITSPQMTWKQFMLLKN